MANEVKVVFIGDPGPLFKAADDVEANSLLVLSNKFD
jgi:hypothetical protein